MTLLIPDGRHCRIQQNGHLRHTSEQNDDIFPKILRVDDATISSTLQKLCTRSHAHIPSLHYSAHKPKHSLIGYAISHPEEKNHFQDSSKPEPLLFVCAACTTTGNLSHSRSRTQHWFCSQSSTQFRGMHK